MLSTSGDVQYIGVFSTLGGYHEYIGRYHEYIRGVQYIGVGHDAYGGYHDARGEQVDKNLLISIENSNVLNIPQCNHDVPLMYSWYPPNVLNNP